VDDVTNSSDANRQREVDKLSWPQLVLFTNLLRKTDHLTQGKCLSKLTFSKWLAANRRLSPPGRTMKGEGVVLRGENGFLTPSYVRHFVRIGSTRTISNTF